MMHRWRMPVGRVTRSGALSNSAAALDSEFDFVTLSWPSKRSYCQIDTGEISSDEARVSATARDDATIGQIACERGISNQSHIGFAFRLAIQRTVIHYRARLTRSIPPEVSAAAESPNVQRCRPDGLE